MNSFAGNEDLISEVESLGMQVIEVPVKNGNIVLPEDIRVRIEKNGDTTVRIVIQRLREDSDEGNFSRNEITEKEINGVVKAQRIMSDIGMKILKAEGSLYGSDFLERVIEFSQIPSIVRTFGETS